MFARQEDIREPARKFVRELLQRQHFSGTDRALHLQLVAVEMVVAFKGFDDQVVDREPDRAAPVGVAAEKVAIAFAGNIIDTMFLVPGDEDVGLIAMDTRDRAQSVGREKLVFVEHVA